MKIIEFSYRAQGAVLALFLLFWIIAAISIMFSEAAIWSHRFLFGGGSAFNIGVFYATALTVTVYYYFRLWLAALRDHCLSFKLYGALALAPALGIVLVLFIVAPSLSIFQSFGLMLTLWSISLAIYRLSRYIALVNPEPE